MTVKVVRELGVKFKAVIDRSSFGQLNKRISDFRNATVGISLATAGVAFSVSKLVNSTRAVGDMLDKAALRTGASTDALQRIGYAAELSGAGLESVIKAMQELRKSVDDPGKQKFFAQLGISVEETGGDIVKLFERVREALGTSDQADFIGQQLLAEGFKDLSPLIQATTADYQKMKAQAIIMDSLLVRQGAALTDLQSKLKGQFGGLRNLVNAQLLPAFGRLTATFSQALSTREVRNFASALGALGAKELENVGNAFNFVFDRIGDISGAIKRLPAGSTGILASLAGIATGVPGSRFALFSFLADDILKLVGAIRLGGDRIGETVIGSIFLKVKKLFTDFITDDNIFSRGLRSIWEGLTTVASAIGAAVNSLGTLFDLFKSAFERIGNSFLGSQLGLQGFTAPKERSGPIQGAQIINNITQSFVSTGTVSPSAVEQATKKGAKEAMLSPLALQSSLGVG